MADEPDAQAIRTSVLYMRDRSDRIRAALDALADWLVDEDDDDGDFDADDTMSNIARWAKQIRRRANEITNDKDDD